MTKFEKGIVTIIQKFFEVDQDGMSWARIIVSLSLLLIVLGYVGASDYESMVIK